MEMVSAEAPINEETVERLPMLRVARGESRSIEDIVVRETPLTIFLNNQELVTLLCTPENLKYLAIGFLSSEGLINSKDEIERLVLDEEKGMVWVKTKGEKDFAQRLVFKRMITSGCGRSASFYSTIDATSYGEVKSQLKLRVNDVFTLVNKLQQRSPLYRATGGVHSAALCNRDDILIFSEDIGRHNAIDKIFGECLLKDIKTDDKIIITSGRISSEILLKAARRSIPIIISRSAPTSLAVKLAARLGVTTIGFVRGRRMNIYANSWRVHQEGGK